MQFCSMKKPLDILLIEDDIDDVDLLKDALHENNVHYKMEVIMEGDKVNGYLKAVKKLPEIIVMDLNLPKAGGKEILQNIKSSCALTAIPIVVLTTSSSKDDIEYCTQLGISKFITKPATIEGWSLTASNIVNVAVGTAV